MKDLLQLIQEKRPVVHCITNSVTMNDCANILLAVGASPIMAHHIEEAAEITSGADALVCNLGATYDYDAMRQSVFVANKKGIPVVLDPVGSAASTYRRTFALELLQNYHIDAIRGNYSEIVSLLNNSGTGNGLDNHLKADELPLEFIQRKALSQNMVILASGKKDYIFGDPSGEIYCITAGDPMMSRITGAGCMLTVLTAATLSVSNTAQAAAKLCQYYGDCGRNAAIKTKEKNGGTATFRTLLLDETGTFLL